MKKLFNILSLFALFFVASSCEEHQNKTYVGNADKFTFLSFDESTFNLEVPINGETELIIPLKASATSPVDRQFGIVLIEEESTANPLTYNLPATVTIPANEYIGNLVIAGQDLDLVDQTTKSFVFEIVNLSDNEFMDNNKIKVDVFEVCPLFAPFEGSYVFSQVVEGDFGPTFAPGTVLQLGKSSEYGRYIEGNYIPEAISGFNLRISFTLSCNQVVVNSLETSLTCTGGEPYLALGPASVNATYDEYDDSEIMVTYTENTNSACGAGPKQVTFKLTKQQ